MGGLHLPGGSFKYERVSERFEDAMLLALKVEKGTASRGTRHFLEAVKGKDTVRPLLEGTRPCQHLDSSPEIPILGFGPPEL